MSVRQPGTNIQGRPIKNNPLDANAVAARSRDPPKKSKRAPVPAPADAYIGLSTHDDAAMYAQYPDASIPGPPEVPLAPPPRVRSVRLDPNVTSLRDRVNTMDTTTKERSESSSFNQDADSSSISRSRSNSGAGPRGDSAALAGASPVRPTRPARGPPGATDEVIPMGPPPPIPTVAPPAIVKTSNRSSGKYTAPVAKGTNSGSAPNVQTKDQSLSAEKKGKDDAHRFMGKRGLQYALWAHKLGYCCAIVCLIGGSFAIAFSRSVTYGCKINDKLINSVFLYNSQGNCPTKYYPAGSIIGQDVCCKLTVEPSTLALIANGVNITAASTIGAIYVIYSIFIVIIEDIDCGIGFGLWFPSDNWFYDKRISPLGLLHILIGILGLTNLGTCLAGVALIINGAVYLEAMRRQEAGDGGRAAARKERERAAKAKIAADEKRGKGGEHDDEVEFECSTCPKTFSNHRLFEYLAKFGSWVLTVLSYNPLSFLYRIYQEDKLAAYFWSGAFIGANVVMFAVTYRKWQNLIEVETKSMIDGTINVTCDTTECSINRTAILYGPFSSAAPFAKACGGCLNFDCAILLLPVIKTVLRKIYDMAGKFQDLRDKTDYFSKCFSHSFSRYVPIQKNIEFHKLIAFTTAIMTAGHIIGHYNNLVQAYDVTMAYFAKWGWSGTSFLTGAIVSIAMFVIFSAAADIIRHTKYEIFFNAHHAFVVFYIVMFLHGPQFWYWGIAPVLLYFYERYQQTRKGTIPFVVTKVEFINPVMAIYFKPVFSKDFQFKEGQYLYLNCPFISEGEWHPFTISSAQADMTNGPRIHLETGEEVLEVPRPANLHPNAKWNKYHLVSQNWRDLSPNDYIDKSETGYNDFLSCHIKIHGLDDPIAKTWTRKFKEYLEMVSGNVVGTNKFPFFFNHVDQRGDIQIGKLLDDAGRPLIRVDGPHSAPSEHFTNYGTCMVVGGGIGLTPCASVVSALIRHRWKMGLNPEIMHLYWVVRQGDVNSFQWLIHLLTELSFEHKKSREEGLIGNQLYIEFNIFVTAVEKDPQTPLPFQKPKRRYLGATEPIFSADKLYDLMLNPTVPSKKMVDIMKTGGAQPNRLQDVWVWNGRPDWDQIFADIKDQRQHSDIGVCFCGAPVIGNDLKKMCEKYSSSRDDCLFTLHKENF